VDRRSSEQPPREQAARHTPQPPTDEQAADVGAGEPGDLAADLDDDAPTGSLPVVEDDEPTGEMPAVGFDDGDRWPERDGVAEGPEFGEDRERDRTPAARAHDAGTANGADHGSANRLANGRTNGVAGELANGSGRGLVDGRIAGADRAWADGAGDRGVAREGNQGVGGAAAAAVVARMAIPGLGLVGADGPRVVPEPGSIEEAMRAEYERPRPKPQESVAVRALHAWCRARTAIVPSGFTIQVQVLDPNAPSYRFDLEPPDVDDPEFAADKLSGLLGDLWLTEAQSEQGGWLFARIDAAGRTLRIDRWYDQVPDWWDNSIEDRLDVNGLVRRLSNRGPEWQPSYLEKLYTSAR